MRRDHSRLPSRDWRQILNDILSALWDIVTWAHRDSVMEDNGMKYTHTGNIQKRAASILVSLLNVRKEFIFVACSWSLLCSKLRGEEEEEEKWGINWELGNFWLIFFKLHTRGQVSTYLIYSCPKNLLTIHHTNFHIIHN